MATAKKTTRKTTTATKAPARKKVELTPICTLKPGPTKRAGGGVKGKVYGMVTTKGITVRSLLSAAEKEGLKQARVQGWLPRWVRKGYLAMD